MAGAGKNERAHLRFLADGTLLGPDNEPTGARLDMSRVQFETTEDRALALPRSREAFDWATAPRPRDLPGWRIALWQAWGPGGVYRRLAPLLRELSGGVQNLDPDAEREGVGGAQLWFVSRSMCSLMLDAAPSLPDTALRASMIPDPRGLVVFERPLPGLDADGTDNVVTVGAMAWSAGVWEHTRRPCIGITVYGPLDHSPWLMPLGALVWPVGETSDAVLEGTAPPSWPGLDIGERDPTQVGRSMAEDRRRLLALWLLALSPGLAAPWEPRRQDRASARLSARHGLPSEVRVITLRKQPQRSYEVQLEGTPLDHRVPVTGHWKNQAVGPRWSEHRPIWIDPYIRGPEGTPLVVRPTVKAWTR